MLSLDVAVVERAHDLDRTHATHVAIEVAAV